MISKKQHIWLSLYSLCFCLHNLFVRKCNSKWQEGTNVYCLGTFLQIRKWEGHGGFQNTSRRLHLITREYTFFLSTHETFTTVDYILGYKMRLSKFQGISILQTTFPHHRTIKVEINNRKMSFKRCIGEGINSLGEKKIHWERFTKTLLANSWVKKEMIIWIIQYL